MLHLAPTEPMNPWLFWQLAAVCAASALFFALTPGKSSLRRAYLRALPFTAPGALVADYSLRWVGYLLAGRVGAPPPFGGVMAYGALGALVAVYTFGVRKDDVWRALDRLAPSLALLIAIARIGCFVAGCEHGKATSVPWAVDGRHPAQLYEFVAALFACLASARTLARHRAGEAFRVGVTVYALGRIVTETFREPEAAGVLVSPGQLVSAAVVLFVWAMPLRDSTSRARRAE